MRAEIAVVQELFKARLALEKIAKVVDQLAGAKIVEMVDELHDGTLTGKGISNRRLVEEPLPEPLRARRHRLFDEPIEHGPNGRVGDCIAYLALDVLRGCGVMPVDDGRDSPLAPKQ